MAINAQIDAPGVTFGQVIINRTINKYTNPTFTIGSGTTVPLGDSATLTLVNTWSGYNFHLTNNGTIVLGTGTFTEAVDGTFTNNGTIRTRTTDLSGNIVYSSGSTIEFLGDGDTTPDTFTLTDWGTSYKNLVINATDGTDDVFVLAADLDVDEDLTISAGTLDANNGCPGTSRVAATGPTAVGAAGFLARSGKVDFRRRPRQPDPSADRPLFTIWRYLRGTAQTINFESGRRRPSPMTWC